MKKFVKITAPIKSITSQSVCFAFRDDDEVFLKRKDYDNKSVWKLKKDGLYIRRKIAEIYGLMPGDTPLNRLMSSLQRNATTLKAA